MKKSTKYVWAITLVGFAGCNHLAGKGDAEQFAAAWVEQNLVGAKATHAECQSIDSDDNGYVTCTASATWPEGREIYPIECGVNRWHTGCNIQGCRPLAPLTFRSNKIRSAP